MFKYILCGLILWLGCRQVQAQELQCDVIINSDQVQIQDRRVFTDMRNAVSNFMNNQRWTNETYRPEERIKCRLLITITQAPQIGSYNAIAQIVTSRPVYGTGYETPLLSLVDRSWAFDYIEAQPLQFSENTFTSNLASLLSFYAYLVVGMDRDSFVRLGGSPYYDRALQIMNNASTQAPNTTGWKSADDTRSRYWMLNNLQDPQLEGFRVAQYLYYRQGMDIFIQKPEDARKNMVEAIKNIQQVFQIRPGAPILRSFFETKADEIVSVFKGANPPEKQAVYAMLSQIDPTNITKYQTIIQR
ncbi:type IX secretion system protein PorD [Adhaeribacter rhizoryzae]|uniref:DUF4835 family protein n=1 Tax=Adhaeribacter rhizoryzae TaxID=2607907 RepID=A0A5M6DGF3_9BACT|nr:DUF4835 family protein [Adhaeribacter rhizoryzae]KAA5546637.1 DUF4835 family protein [Adhaeribacter rhizoryzae]